MNQYLLLRDNKQTGPYTADELAAKGLKAYDLVWLDGKSAAWRYPSELPELKPFAPVVEEQPYDRFYKKATEESSPLLEQARNAATKKATVEEKPVEEIKEEPVQQPEIHPKKIYVTLPASNGKSIKKETKKAAASFSQNIGNITEERPVVSDYEKTTDKDLYTQLQERERNKPQTKRSVRPMMLGLVAACILLFGVIIGLYISNMKQQSQNQKLEDIVKRINEREESRSLSTPVNTQAQPQPNVEQVAVDSSNVLNAEPIIEPNKKLPPTSVVKKGNTPVDNKQVVNTQPSPVVTDASIASNNAQEEAAKEKTTQQPAAIESARKNIHQQLLVENSKFKTGVLGGISNLHMTLSNNSRFAMDQVEIEIKYFGPEQKLVKTQTLLFNDLAPGEQKTLEAPRTSRGITIDYAITRIQSKVLGLAQHQF